MFAGNAGRAIFRAEHSEMISAFYRFRPYTHLTARPAVGPFAFHPGPCLFPFLPFPDRKPRRATVASASRSPAAAPVLLSFPELTPAALDCQQITGSHDSHAGQDRNETKHKRARPAADRRRPSVLPWLRPSFPSFLASFPHFLTGRQITGSRPDIRIVPISLYYLTTLLYPPSLLCIV